MKISSKMWVAAALAGLGSANPAQADVQRLQFQNGGRVLTFEILSDRLLHFDYSPVAQAPKPSAPIPTTPFVNQRDFQGPDHFQSASSAASPNFRTGNFLVQVDPSTLCFSLDDTISQKPLTRVCPTNQGLALDQSQMQNVYGLGEQFQTAGQANGDWIGKTRVPGNKYGNSLPPFNGGYTGNAQFPVMYAIGPNSLGYGFYWDTVYPLRWDFTSSPWKIDQTLAGTDVSTRGYFFLGESLPALRMGFMDLVGHPLVPPKKAFGLWVSEYGYRNWDEVRDKLTTLRRNQFPVDGFVLDVYWYGGFVQSSPTTEIGTIDWDTKNFPDPKNTVADFENHSGVGFMLSEQSYIGQNLANFTSMANRGFLARNGCASCDPAINTNWWGQGGMIDWTNPAAGMAWHNEHRKKLTDIGITFHWTDLGEPEMYNENDYYSGLLGVGHVHADVHNAYNFLWHKSIFDGYESNHEPLRHFILSRSGAPGLQRFGSAMWSGDIGSNLDSLAAHLDAQMHLSMSGIDYFGADVGGFHREALKGDINEVYTKWLASAALFDVPIRPHTDNGSQQFNTAPDRVGDLQSNLFNIRQRYELAPYYYTLAHRAFLFGEPVVPPLVYYFQNDPQARSIAEEKMIGHDLLAATSTALGENNRGVYLPQGDWVNYHTLKWYHSTGQWFADFPLYPGGVFQLPLFARGGAIIPKAQVDDQTMNILGKRMDGTVNTDLIVRVFGSAQATEYHLLEDDGVSEGYRQGEVAETPVHQVLTDQAEIVTIQPTLGTYVSAPSNRRFRVELVLENQSINQVFFNGRNLGYFDNSQDFDDADEGWMVDDQGVVQVKSDLEDVASEKTFEFDFD
jgi:alpha-glucosidase (family GH31 glycosyl hydrolase)